MSDTRGSIGLTPRKRPQGKASNLLRENRPEPAPTAPEPPAATTTATPAAAAKPRTKRASGKAQLSMNIDSDVLGRARAAFRHAQFHDRVPSFGEFVTAALETEIRRIELEHNGGQPLEPETENLPRGRRAGS